jgi:hypothetical protein
MITRAAVKRIVRKVDHTRIGAQRVALAAAVFAIRTATDKPWAVVAAAAAIQRVNI